MTMYMPMTDNDGCCPTIVRLCDGGWCVQNVFLFTPIKPGVVEVYEL